MSSVAQAFAEGGPFMYLILLAGLGIWAPIVAQMLFARRVDLSPALWASLVGLLLLGVLGSVLGAIQAFAAVAMAAPDMRMALIAKGIAICLNTTALSVVLALPASVGIGIAASVARNLRRPKAATS